MSDASGSCLQGILPWWDCSGGGLCVSSSPIATTDNSTYAASIWNTYTSNAIDTNNTTIADGLSRNVMCHCHPDYTSVVFLWFISPGDCYVHGLTRDILLWIALLSSAIGCGYALLRIACGAPRGRRGCGMSCMAALSLGYPCRTCLRGCVKNSTRDTSTTATSSSLLRCGSRCMKNKDTDTCRNGDSSSSPQSHEHSHNQQPPHRHQQHSSKSSSKESSFSAADNTSTTLADWQVLGARGFPMVVAISLFCLTLYFLGAICAPQGGYLSNETLLSPIVLVIKYGLWTVLILGITGVAFGVAHIGQRQVIVASGPAFHRMRRMDRRHKGIMNAQRCFNIGRVITVVTFLIVCALVTSGIVLLVTAPSALPLSAVTNNSSDIINTTTTGAISSTLTADTTNMMYRPFLHQQIVGVQLFGAGITVACVVFASVMAVSSTFVIRIIRNHLSLSSTLRVASVANNNNGGGDTNTTKNVAVKKHPSAIAVSTAADAFAIVILKLSRLRLLVVACLFGSLTIGAVMMIVPGSIEYIFPISVTNGSLLLSIYIAIDSGIATTSYQKRSRKRQQKYISASSRSTSNPAKTDSTQINHIIDNDDINAETDYRCGPCWLDGEGLLTFYGSTIVSSQSSASSSSPAVSNSTKGTISSSGHVGVSGDLSLHYDVERGEHTLGAAMWYSGHDGGIGPHRHHTAASLSMVVNAPHSTAIDDNNSIDTGTDGSTSSSTTTASEYAESEDSSSLVLNESSSYSASVDYLKAPMIMVTQ